MSMELQMYYKYEMLTTVFCTELSRFENCGFRLQYSSQSYNAKSAFQILTVILGNNHWHRTENCLRGLILSLTDKHPAYHKTCVSSQAGSAVMQFVCLTAFTATNVHYSCQKFA